MTNLTYEQLTKRAEREIRDARQRAAACEIGTYGLGLALGEARGAYSLWDAAVAAMGASVPPHARADRVRLETLAYARLPLTE
ncbi:hypothetical protein DIE14_02295 [Burkholderia sp. Bp9017]|uniref:hypothetical protein n=1 Tax=unclassified Burkholderia TaxID=2613784 RepID=UPI000F600EE6|nr:MULTISPECIES: hypothetical protein [unclassified Burkholderia]RQZ31756.1 hypothetical protein DIE14_02295 [Burkholderia sp. Bp9017]RQZ37888.1 hypothetical protein DIE13_02285 [Burkholderia sp. Bp9016]